MQEVTVIAMPIAVAIGALQESVVPEKRRIYEIQYT